MDFYRIVISQPKGNNRKADYVVYPDFNYVGVKELVCKGKTMYAFWNNGHWSKSYTELMISVDLDVQNKVDELKAKNPEAEVIGRFMRNASSNVRAEFEKYTQLMEQSDQPFNQKLLFSSDVPKLEDYSTSQLSYTPAKGPTPAFDELMDKLYEQEELDKILWFIGALLSNKMMQIQKFLYLYGGKGTGKGTAIKVFKMLFDGYYGAIDLELLTSNDPFATGQVAEIPLLIDEDSNLSRIKKDTNLLKLTAHEPLPINQKYKSMYTTEFSGLLITASNQRYKVRNIDAGITRRAVVARPTNQTHNTPDYFRLMEQIEFELPYIARKAMDFFKKVGPYYYEEYMDIDMAESTDYMFSFMRDNAVHFRNGITLKQAGELYKMHLEELGFETRGYKQKLKLELQRYFEIFKPQVKIDGVVTYNYYDGFKESLVFPEKAHRNPRDKKPEPGYEIKLDKQESMFDSVAKDYPAQYATKEGFPKTKWNDCITTLKDLDTSKLHYLLVPLNHIVLDFDLKNSNGEKDRALNLEAASKYPPTYTELSKSGQGVHLHYIYDGDVTKLAAEIEPNVEIKVFSGLSALRRKLTLCNDARIAHIATGLPFKKEEPSMYGDVAVLALTEKIMRTMVTKNLKKEYHGATKPSIDYIVSIFEKAEYEGVGYDLSDLRGDILTFASRSTNNSKYCIKKAMGIKYSTIDEEKQDKLVIGSNILPDKDLYFYDVEVFPNVTVVVYKKYRDPTKHVLFNPTPSEIEHILQKPLVGFNNRKYDNHILYGILIGLSPYETYLQSQKLVQAKKNSNLNDRGTYSGAYETSYADIYEYSAKKQSLKKWEIEMGIKHDEFEEPWDKPLDESKWERCAEYCGNDVDATEALFDYIYADYVARKILSELSGLAVNAATQQHAAKILFGDTIRPQDDFIHEDLSKLFPGYTFSFGKSEYRGINPSEGGYVYSNPGIYKNVGLFDVKSMHPTSAINMRYFGPYTQGYKDLRDARVAIKEKRFEDAKKMFNGRLSKYLEDESIAKDLAYALKIIINIVYGMSSASYDNVFKAPANNDNVIAKRGALFMIDLQLACQEKGWDVVHIKTDSIKIANVTQEIADFVMDFGTKYGYEFDWEHTYSKMALVNKAVYIAQLEDGSWEPTGTEFAQPYVLKTLFTHEPVVQEDFAITKSVKSAIYLDEQFIGKNARVYPSLTGHTMTRRTGDDKPAAVTGTKGYLWKLYDENTNVKDVDMSYFDNMVRQAVIDIQAVGDISMLLNVAKDIPEQYWDSIPVEITELALAS